MAFTFRIDPNASAASVNNGFADIPTVWLEPEYVDKYNLNKVVIDSGFHSAASIYKE